MNTLVDFIKLAIYVVRRKKKSRTVKHVETEYTATWKTMKDKLERASTLEAWLEDTDARKEKYYNINGKYEKKIFNADDFYRKILVETLEKEYSQATSVAEFGSGVGMNLAYLHLRHPHLKLYGFELCAPGVEIANLASKKFNLPIQYFQLDYANWIPSNITMPTIDVAFTNFSLEQMPDNNLEAMENILSHVRMGTFHLEPVVENYPWNIKGVLAKINHYKVGYLQNFEKNIKTLVSEKNITSRRYDTAHNPLMYPSLYVLKK